MDKYQLFLLFVGLLSSIHLNSAEYYYRNQPYFSTKDGHLLIKSNRPISIKTKGNAKVLVGDVDLIRAVENLRTQINQTLPELNYQNTTQDLINLFDDPDTGIMARLNVLENRTTTSGRGGTSPSTRVPRLNRRCDTLDDKINALLIKLEQNNCLNNPCQNGGTCINRYDGFMCRCPENWQGNTCGEDVNECAIFSGTELGCQNGGMCVNTYGGYLCQCTLGYKGIHCNQKEVDCTLSSKELCGNGYCVNVNNYLGYQCVCDPGWTTDKSLGNPACVIDINECETDIPHCSRNPPVLCRNLPGSYTCGPCPSGYTGNGYYCADINECTINNGGCSIAPTVPCHNTRGSFYCGRCPEGFLGDGRVCTRTHGLCASVNYCHPMAHCVENGDNTVSCACPAGFTGMGIGPTGCPELPRDECSSQPCQNGGTCSVNGTSYSCSCDRLHIGRNCDTYRFNPCTPNPCQNGGSCHVTDTLSSSSICVCSNGFTGELCEIAPRGCGGVRNGLTGRLAYPATSGAYQHNSRCAWLIKTNETKILNIRFEQFNVEDSIECRFDWLQIHDGPSPESRSIGRYCGNDLPNGGEINSTHNKLYLWFRSDNSTSHSGFILNWSSIDPSCGSIIDTDSHGSIASPGSPGRYPVNRDCYWTIKAPRGKRLQLSFYMMQLENNLDCDHDFLAIYSEDDTSVLLEKFCNRSTPAPLISMTNMVNLHFHSDGEGSDTGFQIFYSVINGYPGCGGTFTAASRIIKSPIENGLYPNNVICDYLIRVSPENRIRIQFLTFDLEGESSSNCEYDKLEIYDGDSNEFPLVGRFCGSQKPQDFTSRENNLFISFSTDLSQQLTGFSIKYQSICGGTYTDETGVITSPNYPNGYSKDSNCEYYIIAPIGKAIIIEFDDFVLEGTFSDCTRFDFVEIFDGVKSNETSAGKYCGDDRPGRFVSSMNYVHISLVSDGSIQDRGFRANYSFIDIECGGVLHDSNQTFGPSYEDENGEYKHSQNCTWIIIAPTNKRIRLSFAKFDIESSTRCSFDKITIYDSSADRRTEIGNFCGRDNPGTVISSENMLIVKFQTDESRAGEGFTAVFEFIDATCGGYYYGSSGTIQSPNYPQKYGYNLFCEYFITAPPGRQIVLIPKDFDLEAKSSQNCRFDYLEIRNGGRDDSPLINKYCGDNFKTPIRSFGNKLYMKFKTDYSRSEKGFQIEYDSTATGCGGVLSSHRGSISSPNYPNNYHENAICTWAVTVSEGSSIQLEFTDLDMEIQDTCYYDFVEIFDGKNMNAKLIGRFCDKNETSIIETTSNVAFLRMRSDFSNSGRGFNVEYTTNCNRTITGHYGVITSLNYPENYPDRLNCRWQIEGSLGSKIHLEFTHFDLEEVETFHPNNACEYDYVKVIQIGENNITKKEEKFCQTKPPTIETDTNVVVIEFVTDPYVNDRGFRLEWKANGCDDILTRPYEIFKSPNYPSYYPINTHCMWHIQTTIGQSIELTINDYAIEDSPNCTADSLTVQNFKNDSHPLAVLCGTKSERKVITGNGNEMFVKFISNNARTSKGFRAQYRFVASTCGGIQSASEGIIMSPNYPINYPPVTVCNWIIKTDRHHSIALSIMGFAMEHSTTCRHDYLRIYDGVETVEGRKILEYCDNHLPEITEYFSTENTVSIQFKSDESFEAKGFKLKYRITCGGRVNVTGWGILNFHEPMTNNCTWYLKATRPSERIEFKMTKLSIYVASGHFITTTNTLWIELYNGDSLDSPRLPDNADGISTGQYLTIHLAINDTSGTSGADLRSYYSVYEGSCGGDFEGFQGRISSPNYPQSYPIDRECIWAIRSVPGNKMLLTFNDIDIVETPNCNTDYLEIRETDSNGKLLGIFCGNNKPLNVSAAFGYWIKFRSGDGRTAKGFLLNYQYANMVEITGSSGYVSMPINYFQGSASERTITYRISVEYGSIVQLTVLNFFTGTEDMDGNCNVIFTIFDGYDNEAPVLADLCGNKYEPSYLSVSNVVFIYFLQNVESLDGAAIDLKWKRVPKPDDSSTIQTDDQNSYDKKCGNLTFVLNHPSNFSNFSTPGYPHGYENNLDCSWIITTNLSTYHPMLLLQDIDISPSEGCVDDYFEVFSSPDLNNWKSFGRHCGSEFLTNTFYDGAPYLRIDFHTNYYNNRSGVEGAIIPNCGNAMRDRNGVIDFNGMDSTFFNRLIDATENCMWNITVRPGKLIKLTFEKMEIPMVTGVCDTVISLRDGIDDHSPILGVGKYCGTTVPGSLLTSSNHAFVKLVFGKSLAISFKMRYEEVSMDCNQEIILTHQFNSTTITSPKYPKVPDPHTECTWSITAPSGEYITAEFLEQFDLINGQNCIAEYVELSAGLSSYAPVIDRYCSSKKPVKQIIKNNVLRVKYFTATVEPHHGFKLRLSISGCSAIFHSPTGVVASPNYPLHGPPNTVCEYHIIGSQYSVLNLTFEDIDLPSEASCNNTDTLEIIANNFDGTNVTLGKYCSDEAPKSINSLTNEVIIRYTIYENPLTMYRGWKIQWVSQFDRGHVCGGDVTADSGEIISPSYPTSMTLRRSCLWTIIVSKGRRIKIDFDDFDFVQGTTAQRVTFYNSRKSLANHIITYAGRDMPITDSVYSSDNVIRVQFTSSLISNTRGFKIRYSSDEGTICLGDINQRMGTIVSPNNYTGFVCEYQRTEPFYEDESNIGTIVFNFSNLKFGTVSRPSRSCTPYVSRISVLTTLTGVKSICGVSLTEERIMSINPRTLLTSSNIQQSGEMNYTIEYKVNRCGGTVEIDYEVLLTEVKFTDGYGAVDCAWLITTGQSEKISFNLTTLDFKLPSDREYLHIYQGGSPTSPLIRSFGEQSMAQSTFISQRNLIYIEYHSESYNKDSRFVINLSPSSRGCGALLTRHSQYFRSPKSNRTISLYPNNIECIWEITAAPGNHIGLIFYGRFFLEYSENCIKDYVEMFDWRDNGWLSLGRECGRDTPSVYNSTSTQLKVVFRSDEQVNGDGFEAFWFENCGGVFNATEKVHYLVSPNYPNSYPNNLNCTYTITAPKNKKLTVNFLNFSLENNEALGAPCSYDNMTVHTETMMYNYPYKEKVGVFCGLKGPESITNSEKVIIEFMTDQFASRKGFRLSYQVGQCGGVINEPTILESPLDSKTNRYQSGLDCYWNITAPSYERITIEFESFEVEHGYQCTYDFLEIYKGVYPDTLARKALLCGSQSGFNINIDGNKATMRFRSDTSNQEKGFKAIIKFARPCDQDINLSSSVSSTQIYRNDIPPPNFLECHYMVTVPIGNVIKTVVQQMSLPPCRTINSTSNETISRCSCNFIEVRDGISMFSELIGRYCGDVIPSIHKSSGSALWMRYVVESVSSNIKLGVKFELEPSVCGDRLINLTDMEIREIKSPGTDLKYLSNLRCNWIITAPDTKKIEIDFVKIDLQGPGDYGDCSNDKLQLEEITTTDTISEGLGQDFINNGQSIQSSASFYRGIRANVLRAQYCGNLTNNLPSSYISENNKVSMRFESDSDVEGSGFKLRIRALPECGRNYSSTQGRFIVSEAKSCQFWINAPENYSLTLNFASFYISESDCDKASLNIYEGDESGKLLVKACGWTVPDPVFSSQNSLFIKFIIQPTALPTLYNHVDLYYLASDKGVGCGGDLFNYGGIFASPIYPKNDRNYTDCTWNIVVPINLKVALRFSNLDMGPKQTCDTNNVVIIEPAAVENGIEEVVRVFCGQDEPDPYRSKSNKLVVRFRKTINFGGTGFLAHFMGVYESLVLENW